MLVYGLEQQGAIHQVMMLGLRRRLGSKVGARSHSTRPVRLEAPHLFSCADGVSVRSISALVGVRHGPRHQHVGQLLVGVDVFRLDLVVERFFL